MKINSHISPDFVCLDGTRYEIKTLYGRSIIFYEKQLESLNDNDIILVFDRMGFIKEFLWRDRNKILDIKIMTPNDIKKRISITLDEEIIEKINKKAKEEHLSISTFLNKELWKL